MRTLRAVDVMPGETVTHINGEELSSPGLVIEHYRPFNLPSMVALYMDNRLLYRGELGTPITVR